MNFNFTYDLKFEALIAYLRAKYPEKLFDIEGIGKQTDLAKFSKDFFASKSTSDVSVDANSNVDEMSVIAYNAELPKPFFRVNALYLLWKYARQLYDEATANQIIESQLSGEFYINDLHGLNQPYCFNFSCYDIMTQGLPFVKKIKSAPPKHLSSFIGQMIHFTVYGSNSILGAVGLADFLIITSYYVKKLMEEDIYSKEEHLWKAVKQEIQSFIYSCNQPFRAGLQSGFYNVSVYDDVFLDKMCSEYIFPDMTSPDKEIIKKLQILYMDLMNETLRATPITFPVTTACFSVDENKKVNDVDFLNLVAEKNLEFAYINMYFGATSTLSSCCRLRSETKNEYFNQFGAGGTKIGSLGVVTLNLPRIAYEAKGDFAKFFILLKERAKLIVKINNTKRFLLNKRIKNGALPLYDFDFMNITTQYSTTGINGINEAVTEMGLDILQEDGQSFVTDILGAINSINEAATKQYNAPHNCEQTPSENSAIKLATKDKILGLQEKYSLYSNQFIPLTTNADMLDRIKLQGLFDSRMTGGAICHINVENRIEDIKQMADLMLTCANKGVIYFAINYNLQECEHGHMTVGKHNSCPICGGKIINNYTRVVGFLTNTKNWSPVRREDDYPYRVFYEGVS